MNKETIVLILVAITFISCIVAQILGDWFSVPYALAGISFGYGMSLCQGGKQITLPTQSLDEARELMKDAKERWHLVAVTGHCVVAYRSEQKAFDALGRDGIGYAVVGGA